MARPSTTFQKRQREVAKRQRRREKLERRETRAVDKDRSGPGGAPIEVLDPADVGLPQLEFLHSEEHRLPEDIREKYTPESQT